MTAVGRKASQIDMRAIEWVWLNRLGRGVFSGFDGDPERGKSQHLAMMAAHVTTGKAWPSFSSEPKTHGRPRLSRAWWQRVPTAHGYDSSLM